MAESSFHYKSDLMGGTLLVRESRIIAGLLLKKINDEKWKQAIEVDNVLQRKTISTAKRFGNAVKSRLELLEPEFWKALRDGDEQVATQVAFCGALERNLLLVEFIEIVVKDAYITHMEKLETYHWSDFVYERGNRDGALLDWKESTINRMGRTVFSMLAEVGYLNNTRNKKLQNVLIRPEVKALLKNNAKQRLLACVDIKS